MRSPTYPTTGATRWRISLPVISGIALPAAVADARPRKGIFGTMEDWISGPTNGSGILPGAERDPEAVVGTLITTLLGFLGVIFMVLIIYGGYLWMTARGNEPAIEKAKKIITSATVGLAIVLGAYLITFIVLQLLTSPTTATP